MCKKIGIQRAIAACSGCGCFTGVTQTDCWKCARRMFSVLHVMGFDRRDMASARRDAFFRTNSVCVGGLSCGRRSPSVVLKAFAFLFSSPEGERVQWIDMGVAV